MATKNIVPNDDSEGGIGTSSKYWATGFIDAITTTGNLVIGGSIDLEGDIDVNGTTNLDIVDIDGAVNMATTALVTGVLTTTAATVFNGGFTSNAASTISTADNLDTLSLISTDADANAGPNLRFYRNSASPANSDDLGFINFYGENSANEETLYGQIRVSIADSTNSSEDSRFIIQTATGGVQETSRIEITGTETIINEDSKDLDFRVESDNLTDAFFVQGSDGFVGIGTDSPSSKLTVSSPASYSGSTFRLETLASPSSYYLEFVPADEGSSGITWTMNQKTGSVYTNTLKFVQGKVGIGEPSPDTKLHVNNGLSNVSAIFESTDAISAIQFKDTGGVAEVGNSGNDVILMPAGTEKMRIASGGNATVSTGNLVIGTSGKGIDFTSNSVSEGGGGGVASSTLDDYEEGNWVPTIRGSETAGTYELGTSPAFYTKVGRVVTVNAYVQLASSVTGGGSGYTQITGLPFAKVADTLPVGAVYAASSIAFPTDNSNPCTYAVVLPVSVSSTSVFYLAGCRGGGATLNIPISSVGASTIFAFEITYNTA
jgi:hypothetical protein